MSKTTTNVYSADEFRALNKLETRKKEAIRVLAKYPKRCPFIVYSTDHDLQLKRNKYLVPRNITVGQFMYIIRKKIKLNPCDGLFPFLENNTIPAIGYLISQLYEEHKCSDGFLYLNIRKEQAFG